jgi:hypothetical protein
METFAISPTMAAMVGHLDLPVIHCKKQIVAETTIEKTCEGFSNTWLEFYELYPRCSIDIMNKEAKTKRKIFNTLHLADDDNAAVFSLNHHLSTFNLVSSVAWTSARYHENVRMCYKTDKLRHHTSIITGAGLDGTHGVTTNILRNIMNRAETLLGSIHLVTIYANSCYNLIHYLLYATEVLHQHGDIVVLMSKECRISIIVLSVIVFCQQFFTGTIITSTDVGNSIGIILKNKHCNIRAGDFGTFVRYLENNVFVSAMTTPLSMSDIDIGLRGHMYFATIGVEEATNISKFKQLLDSMSDAAKASGIPVSELRKKYQLRSIDRRRWVIPADANTSI